MVVRVGAKLEVLDLTAAELRLEELVVEGAEVVVGGGCDVVVGDGMKVVKGITTLVAGIGEGDGEGEGEEPPDPKSHEPVRTPTETSAKNSKRPCEKSRPSVGHPGHYCCGNIWYVEKGTARITTHLIHNLGCCCLSIGCDGNHLVAILTSIELLNGGLDVSFYAE